MAADLGSSLFNTGVMVVRNSKWSRDFFARVLRMGQHHAVRHHGRGLNSSTFQLNLSRF